jgi:hypothetical protein
MKATAQEKAIDMMIWVNAAATVGRCNRRGGGVLGVGLFDLEGSMLGSVKNFRRASGLLKIVRSAAVAGLTDSGPEEHRTEHG